MKNLAGHDISLFLFRFVLHRRGINFVMNESIAEDLYPETELKLKPIVHACSETLLRYKDQCCGETIMDGNLLVDGDFEVMLSPGLGRHFILEEKKNLFSDAHEIAKLLMDVMDRRTIEIDSGEYLGPQAVISSIGRTGMNLQGLESLGNRQQNTFITQLPQLTKDVLPDGVNARVSYDHRGHCLMFLHDNFGVIGKVVLVDGFMPNIMAELSKERSEHFDIKKTLMEQILTAIEVELINQVSSSISTLRY